MNYKIKFHPKAEKEFYKYDGRIKKLIIKQIIKIQKNPNLGQLLGNKREMDLTGYKKIYVDNKKIRIIYKEKNNELIIFIIAIGNRKEMEVYKNAHSRQ